MHPIFDDPSYTFGYKDGADAMRFKQSEEERSAWDMFVSAWASAIIGRDHGNCTAEVVAWAGEFGDAMLVERRKRFGGGK